MQAAFSAKRSVPVGPIPGGGPDASMSSSAGRSDASIHLDLLGLTNTEVWQQVIALRTGRASCASPFCSRASGLGRRGDASRPWTGTPGGPGPNEAANRVGLKKVRRARALRNLLEPRQYCQHGQDSLARTRNTRFRGSWQLLDTERRQRPPAVCCESITEHRTAIDAACPCWLVDLGSARSRTFGSAGR